MAIDGDNSKRFSEAYRRIDELSTLASKDPAQVQKILPSALQEIKACLEEQSSSKERVKQAEEEFMALKEKTRDLLKRAPTGIYEIDFYGPRFLMVNDFVCAATGYTREELLAMSPFDLLADESKVLFQDRIRRQLAGEKIDDTVEYRGKVKDGREMFWVLKVTFTYDAEGQPVGAIVVGEDITERKRAEEALKLTSYTLDKAREIVIWFRPNGRIFYANDAACESFGYSRDEMLSLSIFNINPNYTRAQWNDRWEMLKGKGSTKYVIENRAKDGHWFPIDVMNTYIKYGGSEFMVGYARDITERKRAEETLRDSEDRFNAFMNNSPAIAWMKDERGRYVYLSKTYEDHFGVKLDEWRGKTDLDIWPREIAEVFSKNDQNVLATGRIMMVEEKTQNPDGSFTYWMNYKFPFQDASGSRYVGGIGIDITESKQAEEALRISEDKFSKAFRNSPNAITITRLSDGKIIEGNESAYELLGYSHDEVIGKTTAELNIWANPDDRQKLVKGLASKGFIKNEEFVLQKKDKSPMYVNLSASLITLDNQKCFLSSFIDITDRKKAEEALRKSKDELEQRVKERTTELSEANEILRESEERFSKAFYASPAAMAITEKRTGCHLDVNEAWLCICGFQREEVIGRSSPELGLMPSQEHRQRVLEETLAEKANGPTEVQVTRKDGKKVVFLTRAIPFELRGCECVLSTGIDITTRKQAEEELVKAKEAAEAAVKAKAAFLANMSHELRTPLNAILGMTSLLLDEDLSPEHKDYLETVRNSGDALLSLINDVLYFSKMEAGRTELDEHPFDLRACIEEALDLIATAAAKKDLNLAYMMDKSVPETIVSDPGKIRQILGNLLSNAVKFTDKGEITVSVSYAPAGVRDDLSFAVADTGIGISEDLVGQLFQPFHQLDVSSTRKYEGTGLGLAISRNLVEKMGGRIWVESVPGLGSTFYFMVKVKAAPEITESCLKGDQPHLAGKRLLIADENRTNRRIIGHLAHEWGMVPMIADSGLKVAEMINRGDVFDAAILGSRISDIDVSSLARIILGHIGDVPLIMLSHVGEGRSERFKASITRPIKPAQLYHTLTDLLDHQGEKELLVSSDEGIVQKGLRVLLAEDNPSNQKVTLQMLRKLGYRADAVSTGKEALEALERQPYDVVLMDIKMPVMDGFEATREIRRLWPEGPKIIAITAYALQGDREKCLEAGMDDYLGKPVKRKDLEAILMKYSGVPA